MKFKSLEDLENFSKKISKLIKKGDTFFLFGEIGVGKTTFVRNIINNIEKKNKLPLSQVLSPTFNIVYDYDINNLKIVHYDLYRIKKMKDLKELGIFENFNEQITLIEWPELIKVKPSNRVEMYYKYTKNLKSRNIQIKGFGKWKDYNFNAI